MVKRYFYTFLFFLGFSNLPSFPSAASVNDFGDTSGNPNLIKIEQFGTQQRPSDNDADEEDDSDQDNNTDNESNVGGLFGSGGGNHVVTSKLKFSTSESVFGSPSRRRRGSSNLVVNPNASPFTSVDVSEISINKFFVPLAHELRIPEDSKKNTYFGTNYYRVYFLKNYDKLRDSVKNDLYNNQKVKDSGVSKEHVSAFVDFIFSLYISKLSSYNSATLDSFFKGRGVSFDVDLDTLYKSFDYEISSIVGLACLNELPNINGIKWFDMFHSKYEASKENNNYTFSYTEKQLMSYASQELLMAYYSTNDKNRYYIAQGASFFDFLFKPFYFLLKKLPMLSSRITYNYITMNVLYSYSPLLGFFKSFYLLGVMIFYAAIAYIGSMHFDGFFKFLGKVYSLVLKLFSSMYKNFNTEVGFRIYLFFVCDVFASFVISYFFLTFIPFSYFTWAICTFLIGLGALYILYKYDEDMYCIYKMNTIRSLRPLLLILLSFLPVVFPGFVFYITYLIFALPEWIVISSGIASFLFSSYVLKEYFKYLLKSEEEEETGFFDFLKRDFSFLASFWEGKEDSKKGFFSRYFYWIIGFVILNVAGFFMSKRVLSNLSSGTNDSSNDEEF